MIKRSQMNGKAVYIISGVLKGPMAATVLFVKGLTN
jgi:hypothetical protein